MPQDINLNSWKELGFDSEAEASGPLKPLIFSHRSKYSASSDKNDLMTHALRCPWLVSVTLLRSLLARTDAKQFRGGCGRNTGMARLVKSFSQP